LIKSDFNKRTRRKKKEKGEGREGEEEKESLEAFDAKIRKANLTQILMHLYTVNKKDYLLVGSPN
jgi:hypothetical protein